MDCELVSLLRAPYCRRHCWSDAEADAFRGVAAG